MNPNKLHAPYPTGPQKDLVPACCDRCHVVRLLPDELKHQFPHSGWWLECPVCETYTMHYLVEFRIEPAEQVQHALPGAETLLTEVERIVANSEVQSGELHVTLKQWIARKRSAAPATQMRLRADLVTK